MVPAKVAQLDACPNGDQEVVGSPPASSSTFSSGDLIMKYFQCHSLPSAE